MQIFFIYSIYYPPVVWAYTTLFNPNPTTKKVVGYIKLRVHRQYSLSNSRCGTMMLGKAPVVCQSPTVWGPHHTIFTIRKWNFSPDENFRGEIRWEKNRHQLIQKRKKISLKERKVYKYETTAHAQFSRIWNFVKFSRKKPKAATHLDLKVLI